MCCYYISLLLICRHSKVTTYSDVTVVGEECHDGAVWNLIKARPDFIDKIFILITVHMELLASQIYLVNHSKNAIGEHGFEYCMKRNPCLQPKWRTFNLAI